MAYHGYIPFIHAYMMRKKNPKILEIGISTGITMFSLLQRLSRTKESFEYTGIDIHIENSIVETLKYMMFEKNQNVRIINNNSLSFLDECNEIFDVVLIDGDHNYYTVFNELKKIDKISHDETIVICDDYEGRWSNRDLFYSERSDYADNKLATPKIDQEKQGVKSAVDDFVEINSSWKKVSLMNGEPVMLVKSNNKDFL